ncbi:MAG: SH3 domain-containing protein [Bacteroidota bacterium]
MTRIFVVLCLVFCFTQCTNNQSSDDAAEQARLEAEKARAEADSLKKLLEASNNTSNISISDKAGLPAVQVKEVGKLNPVDEGANDPTFVEFRNNLKAAIERKDVDYVLSQCHEEIKISFGAESGVKDFQTMWFGDKPDESEFWQTMSKILDLGGTWFSETPVTFVAPYIFTTFPDEYDAFTHAAITGQGVRLRDKPTRSGKHLSTLSYNIVQWQGEGERHETIGGETYPWVKVKTLDGTEGYIFGKYVHSPIGFRAGFSKYDEGWKMKFFVAGD